MSVQTNKGIKRLMAEGEIVMVPMRPEQINNGSVDVSLGRYAFRIKDEFKSSTLLGLRMAGQSIEPNRMAGSDVFVMEDLHQRGGQLVLGKHERVLVHTHEFIGSRRRSIPEMRAKSSMARWGLTVCACAGWGDAGWINRWAMEIYNMNPTVTVVDVGTLVAQIVFHETEEPENGTLYHEKGSYQQGDNIAAIIREWRPEMILPKPMKVVPFEPMNDFERISPQR